MTAMLPPAWVMLLRHLRFGLSLHGIPKQACSASLLSKVNAFNGCGQADYLPKDSPYGYPPMSPMVGSVGNFQFNRILPLCWTPEIKCKEGHPSEHYSGLRRSASEFPRGLVFEAMGLNHPRYSKNNIVRDKFGIPTI